MTINDLKPLDIGGIFNTAFRLSFSNFKKFFKVFLIYSAIYILFYILYAASTVLSVQYIILRGAALLIYYTAVYFLTSVFSGIYTDFFLKAYLGEEWNLKSSSRLVFSRFGTLLFATFLAFLIICGGFILLIIGCIVFGLFLSFIYPVIIFEEKTAGKAVARSFKIVSYSFFRLLGTYFIYILILLASIIIIGGIISIPLMLYLMNNQEIIKNLADNLTPGYIIPLIIFAVVYLILYFVYLMLITSLSSALNIVLYINQKVKFEQFGIENMVESLTAENIDSL